MIIAFANHKGGTGKTTSVINLGYALSHSGKRVLLIDLDPQGNLSYSLGLMERPHTVADLLLSKHAFETIVCNVDGVDVLPADLGLYSSLAQIQNLSGSEYLLRDALKEKEESYDFILIDCAPAFSLYTTNAFNAANGIIVPLVFEILSIQGLDQVLQEIKRIRLSSNANLEIIGVLGVIVNENRKLTEEVLEFVRDNYNVNVFNNHVRNNVKAAEAPSFAKSVISYAPRSTSARDYINVAAELQSILKNETVLTK